MYSRANLHAVFRFRSLNFARLLCAVAKTSPVVAFFVFLSDSSSVKSCGKIGPPYTKHFRPKKTKKHAEITPRDGHVKHVCEM